MEILIADAGLADLDQLLNVRRPGIEVLLVSPGEDAHPILAQALLQRPAAVHLLAHGEPGRLRLGAQPIDAGSLLDRVWPTAGATEILIHACNVGAGEAGRRFLDRLATATGARVAASSRPMGGASAGGTWTHDVWTAGAPRAASPFTEAAAAWPHHLAVTGIGGGGNDLLVGDDANDTIDGGPGDDTLSGGGGDDLISGGLGYDKLIGGAGNDTLIGGDGGDTLDGGLGADYLYGGPDNLGFDRVLYTSSSDAVVVDLGNQSLNAGGAAGDTIVGINLIEGTESGDVIRGKMDSLDAGETGNDWFWGHGGNDTLLGGLGNDTIEGDAGNDWVEGGVGNDMLYGWDDNDTLFGGDGDDWVNGGHGTDDLFGDAGNDTIWGGTDTDWLYGNVGNDLLYGNQGADTLYGGQDQDTLYGGQDADLLYGNMANDVMYGNMADDTMYGGQGDDVLFGGQGNDLLNGGAGMDTLYGNAGADTFVVTGGQGDVIADFTFGDGDRLMKGAAVTWTAADGATGAVVTLSDGSTVTLAGLHAADVTDQWFTVG